MNKMNVSLTFDTLKRVGVVAMTALMIAGCGQNKTDRQHVSADSTVSKPEIVRMDIPFTGTFSQITNVGSVDVEYTTGECRVEAEGPKELLKLVKVSVDSGSLTITYNYDNNPDINVFKRTGSPVKVYVSAPSLRIVSTCSTGNFYAKGRLEADEFMAGTLSAGNIVVDTLVCHGPFRYECKNEGSGTFHCLTTEDRTEFVNEGTGAILVDSISSATSILVNHNGTGRTSLNGVGDDLEIWGFDKADVAVSMDVRKLNIQTYGEACVKFEGSCVTKSVKKNDNSQVLLDVKNVE